MNLTVHTARSFILDKWKRQYLLWIPRYVFTPRFRETTIRLPDGVSIHVIDFASFLSTYKSIFVDRMYDFTSPTKTPTIVICGENIGLSVYFFKKLYPESKVTAFEADPYIFSVLKKNVRSWNLKNVKLFNTAVWNKKTSLLFHSDHADGGNIRVDRSGQKLTTVHAIDLKTYLRTQKNITFLNMDIEGAENTMLLECLPLMKNIPFIFIEYHSLVNQSQILGRFLAFFETSGYRVHLRPEFFSSSPFKSLRLRGEMDMQVNIFAWKE